jgi:hypothetical protein
MAKGPQLAIATLVNFAQVYWRRGSNLRSADAYGSAQELRVLRDSLADHGWLSNFPVPVYHIADAKDHEALVRECLAERQARWDALKTAGTPRAAIELQVFEKLFVQAGRIIEPRYLGNAGFRRSTVFFDAMLDRFQKPGEDGRTPLGLASLNDQVPALIRLYRDEAERIIDQQRENEFKDLGAVAIPALDKLRIARRLFDLGCREARIRELYPGSTAQKLYGICQANLNWPDLKVYERFFLPPADPDHIPFGPVKHDVLIKLNNRFEADRKRAQHRELTEKEKQSEPVRPEEVRDYFAGLSRGGTAAPKPRPMDRSDVEAVSRQNRVKLFRTAFAAVLDNSLDALVPYVQQADGLNLLTDLIDAGKGDVGRAALELGRDAEELVRELRAFLYDAQGRLLPERVAVVRRAVEGALRPAEGFSPVGGNGAP